MSFAEINGSDKGIIFSIKRYSIHDGPGIRTTIFFKGCPLNCWWCHNPEGISSEQEIFYWEDRCIGCGICLTACPHEAIFLLEGGFITDQQKCHLCGDCTSVCPTKARETIGDIVTVSQVMTEIEKDIIFYDDSGGGVTFSGGEPLLQPSFLNSLLQCCKEKNIHTTVDTCGFADTETLHFISKNVDLFLYDLKLIDDNKHKKYTGVSNQIILENLKEFSLYENKIIIRIPIIPGITDDFKNITEIANFAATLNPVQQIDLLPYHNVCESKYQRMNKPYRLVDMLQSSNGRINEIADILRKYGFKVVVGG